MSRHTRFLTTDGMPAQFLHACALILMHVFVAMRLFVVIFLLFFATTFVATATAFENSQLTETQLEELAHHPVWLELLHFDTKRNKSEILSDEFFLSPNGQSDPKAELMATLEAYFAPWTEDTNTHPRCRFPARFFWLSHQIPLPDYTLRMPQCTRLEKWALFDEQQSISLLLVSGYFGNPASTFGHSLLKLNTDSSDEPIDLLNLSINFGAQVPENEPIPSYIVKGLLGGYQASFSDKYFYAQDLVYSRTEFRDMWEYELVLPDFERTLLILHIWEVVGKKFTYFFLKKNCAFRLTELLELVIPEPLLDTPKFWYVPVETFHRLSEIDRERRKKGEEGLIQSVRFIPSNQRKLYHQFDRLNNKEKKAVETIIQEGHSSIPKQLTLFTQDRQLEVLDTVLAYHKYRIVAEQPSPGRERLAIKDQVLLAQLRLPPQMEPISEVPVVNSPANGNRPMLIGLGVGHKPGGNDTHITLRWAPFSQESIGNNSLEGDELVVLDTTIGIDGSHYTVFFDKVDIIRIRKIKTTVMSIGDENPWSWQLHMGTMRTEPNDTFRYDGIFSFGAGRAWKLNNSALFYAITEASAHTISPHARLRPHVGMAVGNDLIKSWWYAGAESIDYNGAFNAIWGGQFQYNIAAQFAAFLEVSKEKTTKVSFELRTYW